MPVKSFQWGTVGNLEIKVLINWHHSVIVINFFLNIDFHNSDVHSTLDFVENTVIVTEYYTQPRNSIHWPGCKTDFSGFMTISAFVRSLAVAFTLCSRIP